MSGHHDVGNKELFAHPELVRDLLAGFTELACLRELQASALERVNASYVSEQFAERHGDMVWKLRLDHQTVFVYLLLEFQSQPERWMALRIQVYVGLLYQDLVKRGELADDARLPPVLPVVLYNGKRPWTASNELRALVASGPDELAQFQVSQRYLLIDQRRIEPAQFAKARKLVSLLFEIELFGLEGVKIGVEAASALLAWLGCEEQSALKRSIDAWIRRLQSRETGSTVIDCIEQLLEENAMGKRWEHGSWAEWEQIVGRTKAYRDVLKRQLTRRFGSIPEPIAATIEQAEVEHLEIWVDRVLDAPSVDAIFSD